MDVNSINAALTSATATSGTSEKSGLGKDAFLKLVVTQLQNQNPLDPIGNSDFLAQLAQFGSLEQSQQLNENLTELLAKSGAESLSEAANLVGRSIEFSDSSGRQVPGIVSAVSLRSGAVYLDVGTGSDVPLSSLVRIIDV
jgi:flagellar basal-body rod modification protein FlgD